MFDRTRRAATVGITVLLLSVRTEAEAQGSAGIASPADRILLVEGASAPNGSACHDDLAAFGAKLDSAYVDARLLASPTSAALRDGLLHLGGTRRAIVYCGEAQASGSDLFVVGKGDAPGDDLALTAVSARAFSRVVGPDGLVVLDLYGTSGGPVGDLARTAASWTRDKTLPGAKFAIVEANPADATLVGRLSGASVTDVAEAIRALDGTASEAAPAPKMQPATPAPVPPASPPPIPPPPAAPPPAAPPPAPPAPSRAPPLTSTSQSLSQSPSPAPSARTTKPVARTATASRTVRHHAASNPLPDKSVRALQVALLAHGAYFGRTDGRPSAELTAAIRRFQAKQGDRPTGILTPDQVKLLQHE